MRKKLLRILLVIMSMIFVCGTMICCGDSNKTPGDPTDDEKKTEYIEGREIISAEDVNKFSDEYIKLLGRTYVSYSALVLDHASTGFEVTFYGTSLSATLNSQVSMYYRVFVDGADEGERMEVATRNTKAEFVKNLTEGIHTVRVVKATSSNVGIITVKDIKTDGKFLKPEESDALRIEFIGDSITVGAGVFATPDQACATNNSDATKSYAYLTAQALKADASIVAAEAMCLYGNFGVLKVDMLEMYELLSSMTFKPYTFPYEQDIVVISLGTNDASYMNAHSDYTVDTYAENYKNLIGQIRKHSPNAYLVCTMGLMYPDTRITNGIQKAITACNDDKISYIDLPTGANGGSAHPSEKDAVIQSEALIAHIRSVVPSLKNS